MIFFQKLFCNIDTFPFIDLPIRSEPVGFDRRNIDSVLTEHPRLMQMSGSEIDHSPAELPDPGGAVGWIVNIERFAWSVANKSEHKTSTEFFPDASGTTEGIVSQEVGVLCL